RRGWRRRRPQYGTLLRGYTGRGSAAYAWMLGALRNRRLSAPDVDSGAPAKPAARWSPGLAGAGARHVWEGRMAEANARRERGTATGRPARRVHRAEAAL